MLCPINHVKCSVVAIIDRSLPQNPEEVLATCYSLVVCEKFTKPLDELNDDLLDCE